MYERSGLAEHTYLSDGANSLLGVRQCMYANSICGKHHPGSVSCLVTACTRHHMGLS